MRKTSVTVKAMEARSVDAIPDRIAVAVRAEWDGFRCLLARDGDAVGMYSKSGQDLSRRFPEVVAVAMTLREKAASSWRAKSWFRSAVSSHSMIFYGMHKIKLRIASSAVFAKGKLQSNRRVVGSLLLGLHDADGLLHQFGFSSGLKAKDKPAFSG
jgi:ATP-dependent DNA ligase